MGVSFIFGQLTSSVTDDQVRAIIYALLGVAFLLGLLTVWYFVHTSPRRRARAVRQSGVAVAPEASGDHAPTVATVGRGGSTVAPPRPTETETHTAGARPGETEPMVDSDDDEWLRLTAPAHHHSRRREQPASAPGSGHPTSQG